MSACLTTMISNYCIGFYSLSSWSRPDQWHPLSRITWNQDLRNMIALTAWFLSLVFSCMKSRDNMSVNTDWSIVPNHFYRPSYFLYRWYRNIYSHSHYYLLVWFVLSPPILLWRESFTKLHWGYITPNVIAQ